MELLLLHLAISLPIALLVLFRICKSDNKGTRLYFVSTDNCTFYVRLKEVTSESGYNKVKSVYPGSYINEVDYNYINTNYAIINL